MNGIGAYNTSRNHDLCPEVKRLVGLCEQARVYCDAAQSRTDDAEMQLLLKLMSEERNHILIELIRYLRAHGRNPDEFFIHIFRHQDDWKNDDCPAGFDGVLCSVYLSEKEMLHLLSSLKEKSDLHLRSEMRKSIIRSKKVKESLLSRAAVGRK